LVADDGEPVADDGEPSERTPNVPVTMRANPRFPGWTTAKALRM